jgi:hypothetical protein
MAAPVVNIVLILAVLVLLATWAIGGIRRRRQDRRQHAEDRTLILRAFLGVGAPAGPDLGRHGGSDDAVSWMSSASLSQVLGGRAPW